MNEQEQGAWRPANYAKIARQHALKFYRFDEEADLSYWGSGKDMAAVDELAKAMEGCLRAAQEMTTDAPNPPPPPHSGKD